LRRSNITAAQGSTEESLKGLIVNLGEMP